MRDVAIHINIYVELGQGREDLEKRLKWINIKWKIERCLAVTRWFEFNFNYLRDKKETHKKVFLYEWCGYVTKTQIQNEWNTPYTYTYCQVINIKIWSNTFSFTVCYLNKCVLCIDILSLSSCKYVFNGENTLQNQLV